MLEKIIGQIVPSTIFDLLAGVLTTEGIYI